MISVGRVGPGRVGSAFPGAAAAKHGTDPRDDLSDRERLDDVIVRAEFEPDNAIGHAPARGDHDDRDVRITPQLPADVAPVAVGQRQVEQHHVGLVGRELGDGVGGGAGDRGVKPASVERVRERLRDGPLVLDEEDGDPVCVGPINHGENAGDLGRD